MFGFDLDCGHIHLEFGADELDVCTAVRDRYNGEAGTKATSLGEF